MSAFSKDELGVLGNLAVALGLFTDEGPNPDWFGNPEGFLRKILADDEQRAALIAFVDEALGGADRTTDPSGVVWLPIVSLEDPDLTLALTIDEVSGTLLHVGVDILVGVLVMGLVVRQLDLIFASIRTDRLKALRG